MLMKVFENSIILSDCWWHLRQRKCNSNFFNWGTGGKGSITGASHVALVIKNLPTNAGEVSGMGSFPGLRRSLGGGHGNPLQYSYLENCMLRGVWWATVHVVAKSWTWLSNLACTQAQPYSTKFIWLLGSSLILDLRNQGNFLLFSVSQLCFLFSVLLSTGFRSAVLLPT